MLLRTKRWERGFMFLIFPMSITLTLTPARIRVNNRKYLEHYIRGYVVFLDGFWLFFINYVGFVYTFVIIVVAVVNFVMNELCSRGVVTDSWFKYTTFGVFFIFFLWGTLTNHSEFYSHNIYDLQCSLILHSTYLLPLPPMIFIILN